MPFNAKPLGYKNEKEIWPDETMYFYTDSTVIHIPYFRTDEQKDIVLDQITKLNGKYKVSIRAYSIAVNHFHLVFYLEKGENMVRVKQALRGGVSYEYKKQYAVTQSSFWQTRRILQIKNDKMYWKVIGYVCGNLLKHREAGTFEDLKDCRYSSYADIVKECGEEEIQNIIRNVIDVTEDKWGSVEIERFG